MLSFHRSLSHRFMKFAAVIFLIGPAHCWAQTATQPSLKIGFSIENMRGERWATDLDEFRQRAQQLGAEVMAKSADGDDDLQFQQVKDLLAANIDVLVFMPHDSDKAARVVEAAHAKHVPVLNYDRLVHNAPVDLYVGFDLFEVGVLQAQSLIDQAPKGNYLLLGGSRLDMNSTIFRSGQMKVLQPLIDRGDIKIVADTWVPEWSPTQAYILVAQALDKLNVPLTAIVASNDGTAGGAIQALEDKKLAGKVLVSGQDADLAAIVRLFDGTQLMTVYKPLIGEARVAAEAAVKLARHQNIETGQTVPVGDQTVKAMLLTPIAVTRANARDTVLKDGFQKIEMVKQGVPKEKWAELDR
jgi:D-xylose transport system substrate-binding protein